MGVSGASQLGAMVALFYVPPAVLDWGTRRAAEQVPSPHSALLLSFNALAPAN